MATGLVKWFDPAKGFGFVTPDGGGTDVFVHVRSAERAGIRSFREGIRISYEVVPDRRSGRACAEDLKLL